MRFSNVLAASVVAPLVAAHGGIEGAPKLFGMPKQLRSRNPFAAHQAPRSLIARQDSGEVCGPTNGNKKCPAGECCSSAGWCGTTPEHCQAPDCQIDFSDSCDASYTPVGETTRNDPRPQLGNIPYGGEGIYVCDRPGTVALTYDDGPYIYTDAMLTLLKEYGAKATFFVTGNNIGKGAIDENWQPVIKRMIAEGHQVASHTWSHQDLSAITREEVYDQMIKNEMAIRNIIGKYPTYMRPPYSSCTAANCQPILKELGYVVSYFDLDTDDYNQLTKEKIETAKANFKNGIDTRNNDPYDGDRLVIAHDIHELTAVDLTKYMLEYIKTNNLKAVTMGECLNDPEANWYRSSTPGQPRPSSTRSATPSKTPSPPGAPTTDGQCGADKDGFTCAGFLDQDGKAANCCSSSGWCGNTADHCGTGCQSLFGDCGSGAGSSSVKPTSSATQVSSTSASAHTPTPTWFSGETSRDGSCGGEKGYTCKGFSTLGGVLSECCSQYGYCGASAEYCSTGCNPLYGKCDGDVSSSVPSSTKHESTSSSVPSSSKHDSTSSAYDHSSTHSASYSASETSKHESSSVHPSATSSGYPQSSPSNTDAYPTSSKDAYPTGSKDSYPSNSKDSYPTGSQDSYPSNSKDSYPTSSKDNTYPTSSKDNTYPTSSKDNSYPTSSKDNTYPTATTSPCSTLKTVVKPSSSPCESSSVKPYPTPYLPVSSDGKCGKDNNGQTCAGYTDLWGNKLECCCATSGKCSNDPYACSAQGCVKGYGKCAGGY